VEEKTTAVVCDTEAVKKEKIWIKAHSISFAFNGDEFLPNPDSKLFEAYPHDQYKVYPFDKAMFE